MTTLTPKAASEHEYRYGLSCAAADFCMPTAGPFELTPEQLVARRYDGADWQRTPVAGELIGNGLSCASLTFCVLAGADGQQDAGVASSWDGTSWTAPQDIDADGDADVDELSCRRGLCAGVNYYGEVIIAS